MSFPAMAQSLAGRAPIQSREDFARYPFDEIPAIFWNTYRPHLDAIREALPPGMKAFGGCIFDVMEDLLALGIDAKHSNEDQIAPFERWIADYGDRIGLFGGIDVNLLCQKSADEVYREAVDKCTRFRASARGYGMGSGNSIPGYVPVDGFLSMIEAAKMIRKKEKSE